jgi:hypothetical protein
MHEFAILAFGGLVVWLVHKLLSQYGRELTKASGVILTMALGVGFAYLVNYSLFAAWGIGVRNEAIGTVVTGFMVAGIALLWEEAIGFFRSYATKEHGEAKKLRRAA